MPPNWTDLTNRAAGYIYRSTDWQDEIVNNLTVLNHFIGSTNGGHAVFADGGILLGNSTAAFQVLGPIAKGSLVVGQSSSTGPAELVVGADNEYLVASSTSPVGVRWATPASLSNPEDIMKYA